MVDVYELWKDSHIDIPVTPEDIVIAYYNTLSRWDTYPIALKEIRSTQHSIRYGKKCSTISGMPFQQNVGDPTYDRVEMLSVLDSYYDTILARCWGAYALTQVMEELLPPRDIYILKLKYMYELSQIEIAKKCAMSQQLVAYRCTRSLRVIGNYLEKFFI